MDPPLERLPKLHTHSLERMIRIFLSQVTILLLVKFLVGVDLAEAQGSTHSELVRKVFAVPAQSSPFPFTGIELTTSSGGIFRYYTSDNSSAIKPLVLFVPGSGCTGAFAPTLDGHRLMGPEAFALPFKNVARLVVIDSPGITERFGRAELRECSRDFKRQETMQARQSALSEVIRDIGIQGWIIKKHFMIAAESEGVSIATRFAADYPEVSHLLLISGFGIGEIDSSLHAALTGWGNWSVLTEPSSPVQHEKQQAVFDQWTKIEQGSDSAGEIAGHPDDYWRTIGMDSPAEDVLKSDAGLYLAQGGRDENFASGGYEAGLSELVAHRRPFVAEYFGCGDHFLICPADSGGPNNMQGLIQRGMMWFLNGKVDRYTAIIFGQEEIR